MKFKINFENEVIMEFVSLVTEEEIAEPISFAKLSEENISGNKFFRGVTKSMC